MEPRDPSNAPEALGGNADIVLDTGVLVEYLTETHNPITEWLNMHLFNDGSQIKLHASEMTRCELLYLLCRENGMHLARETVEKMQRYIKFHAELELTELAARIKCDFSMALADCFSIAVGLHLDCLVLFLQEKELPRTMLEEIRARHGARIAVLR